MHYTVLNYCVVTMPMQTVLSTCCHALVLAVSIVRFVPGSQSIVASNHNESLPVNTTSFEHGFHSTGASVKPTEASLSMAKRSDVDTPSEPAVNDFVIFEATGFSGQSGSGTEQEKSNTVRLNPSLMDIDVSFDSDCALIALEVTEFTYVDDEYVMFREETISVVFWTQNGRPVICSDFDHNGTIVVNVTINITTVELVFPRGFAITTYIGCSLSVVASLFLLVTYMLFKELRTLPSLLLMNLCLAFLVGDVLILVGSSFAVPSASQSNTPCVVVAVLLHYFFLARFCWTNMIAFEMVRSFTAALKLMPVMSGNAKEKTLVVYSIVGWGIPLVITAITIIVNFTVNGLVRYGTETCWINDVVLAVGAFVAPLAVSLLFNIISFIWIVSNLCKSSVSWKSSGKHVTNARVYVAVFSVMGLTWIFGFIAILARTSWVWYPFIILNSTQALIVTVSFTCTKKVALSYLDLLCHNASMSSSIHPNTIAHSNKVSPAAA